jgi:hypothetical protein
MSRARRIKHEYKVRTRTIALRHGWEFGWWHLYERKNYRGECCECFGCTYADRIVGYRTNRRMKPVRRAYYRKSRGWR